MKIILCSFALAFAVPVWAAPQGIIKPPQGIVNDPRIKHEPPSNPDRQMNHLHAPSTTDQARTQRSLHATQDALRRAEQQLAVLNKALRRNEQQRMKAQNEERHAAKAAHEAQIRAKEAVRRAEKALAESRRKVQPTPKTQGAPHIAR